MAKFIKLTFNGKPCIYNVDLILWVYKEEDDGKTMVSMNDGKVDEVEESFDEVERLLHTVRGIYNSSLND